MGRRNRERSRGYNAFWGVVLIGLGVVLLLTQQGILPHHLLRDWWMWWPGILVAAGLVRILRPRDAGDIAGGITSILLAFWFFANFQHWWGLTWNTSWPIALMIAGFGMMVRALVSRWVRDRTDPVDFDPRRTEDADVH